jgi:hypothetical protein
MVLYRDVLVLLMMGGVDRMLCFLGYIIDFINILFKHESIDDGFCCNQMVNEFDNAARADRNVSLFIKLNGLA